MKRSCRSDVALGGPPEKEAKTAASHNGEFARLPENIIRDVLHPIQMQQLGELAKIDGRWGEICREKSLVSGENGKLTRHYFAKFPNDTQAYWQHTLTDARKGAYPIVCTKITEQEAFDFYDPIATNLYGHLEIVIENSLEIPSTFLQKLGNRFSSLHLLAPEDTYNFNDHEIEFINRQLRSCHMQIVTISGQIDVSKILESVKIFTKSENFVRLDTSKSSPLPACVFMEYHQHWTERSFMSNRRKIDAVVDEKGKDELSKVFDFKSLCHNFNKDRVKTAQKPNNGDAGFGNDAVDNGDPAGNDQN
ncbi:hypothetical protein QR680_003953 [Steinernema hermaphroditum]|uniref:F-box domain-containing protein n=1 Tax=Steinernema hermaphroditum TaxID=289476 RepID=A0AA39HNL5_9BILA|nr:hypothetical protein QR680_003953 [Steinernema hermaphroditum]